ncbi:MAG: M1 family metallopeptidase [Bacteroidetes bacterium]|nr:M1 family metallopeptidase [Bacteroidota bacterium]
MKKLLTLILLFSTGYVLAQPNFSQTNFLEMVKGERDAHAGKLIPSALSASTDYDVKYYNCFWNIDPAVSYISGKVTTLFNPTQPLFDSIVFDLTNALTVDSIWYHNTTLTFNHSNDLITIPLPATIPVNTLDSITVFYQGVPGSTGFGSFIQDTHSGTPIIWTLSEPYGSSDWWPCKNGLTDKADSIDIAINTSSNYKAASNGILVSTTPNGNNTIYQWKHRYPIATYLICLAVTNYAEYSHFVPFAGDTLEVVNYIYPEDSASAVAQTSEITAMIQLYDTLFGVYAFQNEKYGHAQFGWGGGMEHQTITFVSGFDYDLLAHELAHHWFGDKVTCGSWEDIWLNEGFATYLAGLCFEHLIPAYWLPFKQNQINFITSQNDGSVLCTDTLDINRLFDGRLTYVKGAMILHQVRWVIGDSAFYAGINSYLTDVTCAYEFARTSDLKSHLEIASGQNLTWYFNDWFIGEGFPSYQINWSQIGSSVYLEVNQTQSHPSVPFFELPLPIQFSNGTQDTIVRIDHTTSGQNFILNIPFLLLPLTLILSGGLFQITILLLPDSLKVYPDITFLSTRILPQQR